MRRRMAITMVAMLAVGSACGSDDGGADSADDAAVETEGEATPEQTAGGEADAADAEGTDAEEDAADEEGADAEESADDEGTDAESALDGLDFGDGLALITIGDTTYEFSLGGTTTVDGTTYIGVCQTLFGLIAGGGYGTDGLAASVEFEIPPEDWETYDDGRFDGSAPRIEIEIDDNTSWAADQTLADNDPAMAGASQIDEWTSDGSKASGSATFIELTGFSAPVEGAQPVQGSFELGCAED